MLRSRQLTKIELIAIPLITSIILYILLYEGFGQPRPDAIAYSSILFAVITWGVQTYNSGSLKKEVGKARCEVHAQYGRKVCKIILYYCEECSYNKLPNQLDAIKTTLVDMVKNCKHDRTLTAKIQKHKTGILGFIRQASTNKIDNTQSNLDLSELAELIYDISSDFDHL